MQENNFIALQRQAFYFQNFTLVPLRKEDIFKIKEWRNSQLDVLRQKAPLTDADQENYYRHSILPTYTQHNPKQILFSFLKDNQCIGYGGLTNIDWEARRIELSYLVDPVIYQDNSQYEICSIAYINLIKQVVFEDLNFNRMFTETYDIRPFHISVFEKCGFRYEGRMRQHIVINGKYCDALLHGYLKEYDL